MTKTLNQIIFFSSTKIRIFFSATLGIRIFFGKKTITPRPSLQVKWSFPKTPGEADVGIHILVWPKTPGEADVGVHVFVWHKTPGEADVGVHVLVQLIFPGKIQMRNCQLPEYKYVQHNFISINPLTNCIFLFRFYLTRSFDSCFIFANNHCINGWPRFGWFMVFNSTVSNISVKLLYRDGKFYW